MATQGCSRCKKHFNSGDGLHLRGFDRENWELRNSSEHRLAAKQIQEETSPTAQQKLCSELSTRYSVLQEHEYFDCIRYFVVDPIHKIYLGTAKHMMKNVWLNEKNDFIRDEDFQRIQELVDSMTVPQDIGRIPGRFHAVFQDLRQISGKIGQRFIQSLGKRVLTVDDIELGDRYLMDFCKAFEELYGKDVVTPNIHLHGYLKECLLDYGPCHAFWCFSFERA